MEGCCWYIFPNGKICRSVYFLVEPDYGTATVLCGGSSVELWGTPSPHETVMTKSTSATTTAFTLVELLIVLAVIAIVAAALFPTLTRAKRDANRTACMGNLKQIDAALRMYADDSSDKSLWLGPVTNRILSA